MHSIRIFAVLVGIGLSSPAFAQGHSGHGTMDHGHMTHAGTNTTALPGRPPSEAGQAAFAAIQEIVAQLMADPETDWARVNIEALRQHLIDMDNVTMRAEVLAEPLENGARFVVTSDDPAVSASIRRMTLGHAATMNGVDGWQLAAEETEGGAVMSATGDATRIQALGFIGLMTVGMHHQAHHLALARGEMPH